MDRRLSRATGRQVLVTLLRGLHYAILGWGLLGWLAPSQNWLMAYLMATPLIALQWLVNRNTCILNNVESWIMTGRWRDESDANQGGFLAGILERLTGRRPSPRTVDMVSYSLLIVFWAFAAIHLSWRS